MKLGPLFKEKGIEGQVIENLSSLEGKVMAIDGLVTLYEMLSIIRDREGRPLRDSQGRITSHLVGLFNRTCRMLALGIKPIYVFDGPPHPLKLRTIEERQIRREEAEQRYVEALTRGDFEEARKYAKQAARIEDYMVTTAKQLLEYLGVPIVQAPHDGEAQAAFIARKGDAYAVGSPDYDSFLYSAPRVVRGLRITKGGGRKGEEETREYTLDDVLRKLNLTHEQLVDLAILIGTDFNPDGFPGIGPKRAYEYITRYGSLERIVKLDLVKWNYPFDINEIRSVFLTPPVTTNYRIVFKEPNREKIIELLVEEHDFSLERVNNELEPVLRRIERESKVGRQVSLFDFFNR
ncbi:MAG: flap endonuclease-1 [Crenarchaeota archaeon]|nr:flap endonuclease-1 [Thermoproteota archaeon]